MNFSREYRLYVTTGPATFTRDIECANDDIAIEQARRLFSHGVIEVWQSNRLIARITITEPAGTTV